jgi:signal transduction histidine kinase
VLARGKRIEIAEEPVDTPHGTRLLHTIKVPVNDAAGRPAYLLGISTDITESKKVERLKSEFISTVSHELRTPLTSIRGALGLLAGGVAGVLGDSARQLLDIALKNSERLTELINDILDIEKIESGKMKFELAPHAIGALVEQAIVANQAYAHTHGVRIEASGQLASVQVRVDAGRFAQVMANLLSNAAKFSPRGGVVEVAAVADAQRVRISVADHGAGIPESFRDRMFQKFSQADGSDTRAKGGTGLGLAITKSIVEGMGGEISYVTQAGQGTTFFVDLARAEVAG